jgi:aminoglycoside 2''-phosphotransferase
MTNANMVLFKRTIKNTFPELALHTLEWLGEGNRSSAVIVNGEIIFRFPKSVQGADDLFKEIQLLPLLIKSISVCIPDFVYIGRQENGLPFVGYRKLPGELVGEEAVPSLSDEAHNKLAIHIAVFLDELSKFPVDIAAGAGVPVRKLETDYLVLFKQVEEHVFPILNESLEHYIINRFKAYLTNPDYTHYVPKLIHGDLSPDHFLVDQETGNLTGIIDFGDSVICDPDYDYVYVLEDCGERFTRLVMQHRGVADPEACLKKVSFFVTFDQLSYVLEGIRTGKEEWVKEGIELIEHERLSQGKLIPDNVWSEHLQEPPK